MHTKALQVDIFTGLFLDVLRNSLQQFTLLKYFAAFEYNIHTHEYGL